MKRNGHAHLLRTAFYSFLVAVGLLAQVLPTRFSGAVRGAPAYGSFWMALSTGRVVHVLGARARYLAGGRPATIQFLQPGMQVVVWGRMSFNQIIATEVDLPAPAQPSGGSPYRAPVSGPMPAATHVILSVKLDPQETDEWCWAASTKMVMDYISPCVLTTQCAEANHAFGLSTACQCPTPAVAINGAWPDQPLNQYGFTFKKSASALSWSDVTSEIGTSGRPFIFTWGWNSGGGHAMTAVGVTSLGPLDFVVANNPWLPYCQRCGSGAAPGGNVDYDTYGDFVGGTGYDHSHWIDYYDVQGKYCRLLPHPAIKVELAEKPPLPPLPTLASAVDIIMAGLSAQPGQVDLLSLGLSSPNGRGDFQPRPPIRVVEVNLRALADYQPRQDPNRLLVDYHSRIVPVAAADTVRFGITVTQIFGGFRVDSFGAANFVQAVTESIERRAIADRISPQQFFLIEIPALSVVLVARHQGTQLLVTSVYGQPQWKLEEGAETLAAMTFSNLRQAAAQVLTKPHACE